MQSCTSSQMLYKNILLGLPQEHYLLQKQCILIQHEMVLHISTGKNETGQVLLTFRKHKHIVTFVLIRTFEYHFVLPRVQSCYRNSPKPWQLTCNREINKTVSIIQWQFAVHQIVTLVGYSVTFQYMCALPEQKSYKK